MYMHIFARWAMRKDGGNSKAWLGRQRTLTNICSVIIIDTRTLALIWVSRPLTNLFCFTSTGLYEDYVCTEHGPATSASTARYTALGVRTTCERTFCDERASISLWTPASRRHTGISWRHQHHAQWLGVSSYRGYAPTSCRKHRTRV